MLNICGLTCMVSEDVHVKTRVRSMSDVSGRCRMLSTTAAGAACINSAILPKLHRPRLFLEGHKRSKNQQLLWRIFTEELLLIHNVHLWGLSSLWPLQSAQEERKKRCKINVARSAGSSGNEVQILALFHCFRYRQEQAEHYFPSHVSSSWSPRITDKCLAVSQNVRPRDTLGSVQRRGMKLGAMCCRPDVSHQREREDKKRERLRRERELIRNVRHQAMRLTPSVGEKSQ